MSAFIKAIVSSPVAEPTGLNARGGRMVIHVRAVHTNGMIGMWEVASPPGVGPDWHTHTRETKVFRVISGTFRFWCGDDVFDLGPGGTITLPPLVPHQWKNVGDAPGQMFAVVAPGGFEEMFIEFARRGSVSREDVLAVETGLGLVDNDGAEHPAPSEATAPG